jgi:hypothetical protein
MAITLLLLNEFLYGHSIDFIIAFYHILTNVCIGKSCATRAFWYDLAHGD